MKANVNIKDYFRTHGKLPRGKGLWVFRTNPGRNQEPFFFNGSYTEAKNAALKNFPRNEEVIVQP